MPDFDTRFELHNEHMGCWTVAGSPNTPLTLVSKRLALALRPSWQDSTKCVLDSGCITGLTQIDELSWIVNESKEVKTWKDATQA